MENGKGKRVEAIDDQLQLPESIIQHIQSFLTGKEAASTAVLSKSWYNSWLTRPALDFDERNFQNQNSAPQNDDKFFNFVKRSMERYHGLNLTIESFKLWMNVRDVDSSSLATELIVKAVKMGANGVNLEFSPPISEYILPKELFEAESLVGLSLAGCKIFSGEVMCLRLKSLHLSKVCVGDDMIRDIMLGCPMIENFVLSDCEGFVKVNVSKMAKLKRLSVIRHVTNPVVFRSPLIEFEEHSVGTIIDGRANLSEFRKLSCLFLERVKIGKMVFSDFANKFPCLEDLTVHHCVGCFIFNISSQSLKYISLAHTRRLEVQLDVPNIRKIKFSGSSIPSLTFITASREWESDIALSCWNYLGVSWLLELKKFLTNLGPSRITLRIELFTENRIDCWPVIQGLSKPIVENLILMAHSSSSVSSALLDGIFWSFRPKVITQCLFPLLGIKSPNINIIQPQFWKASNDLLRLLCNRLMDIGNPNCSSSIEKNIGWHELKEVNAELFEDTIMEWQPLPWKTLLDDVESPEKEVQIRFLLRWQSPEKAGPSHSPLV
ncbi:hypothetical protein Sango_0570100 [Sesamum angolense]|uniref:At1g61320/AtMIF1 LRR domain-containing protein n=1 Tax=Sesamum angolense TaxID=2727404 RepID=A0AAE2C1K8_9LAMI|nr:hypothetical protein Sango_0570100 [Sesamum angolense]